MTDYNITIVGAGIVGASLACALAETDLKIALVDRNTPNIDLPSDGFASRVSAITPKSQQFFESLNLWQTLSTKRITPFTNMCVWDATGNGEINFSSQSIGKDHLGHLVENNLLLKALYNKLNQANNINFLSPINLSRIETFSRHLDLVTQDNQTIKTQLVIGADGGQSWIREQANINCHAKPYEQSAIVTNVVSEQPHQLTAWQRFLPTGPLAFLPMANPHTCSIVWSNDTEQAETLMALDDNSFLEKLTIAFDHRLGQVKTCSKRFCFPLIERHAEAYISNRLVLIGDAAHTIHPLAGQGVNLGLLDVMCLAENIKQALNKNKDFFSHAILRRYERERRSENTVMLKSMKGFKELFCNESLPLLLARNIGLKWVNRSASLKDLIVNYAMGF